MPKRKDSLLEIILDTIEQLLPLYVIYLFALWFTNKESFWRGVFYGFVVLIGLLVIAVIAKKFRLKRGAKWLSDRELLNELRRLTPDEFERYIADLFSKLGYQTNVSGGPYDQGVDIIAEKNGIKHYIQCKKFITREVGVGAVRDFYGALADHLANSKGYFITTNKFTLEAEKFAEDKPIELIDGFKLIQYIRLAKKEAEKINTTTKICPQCGGKLVVRNGKYG
ncbi:MAG: restriction endonuclease, partial [Candidatus Pacebacteria bacterium]|nr:restriction endonuclease [Candidatus Paceibacterota bacterium]